MESAEQRGKQKSSCSHPVRANKQEWREVFRSQQQTNFPWEICGYHGADGAYIWKGFALDVPPFSKAGTKERNVPNQSARDVRNLSLLGSLSLGDPPLQLANTNSDNPQAHEKLVSLTQTYWSTTQAKTTVWTVCFLVVLGHRPTQVN